MHPIHNCHYQNSNYAIPDLHLDLSVDLGGDSSFLIFQIPRENPFKPRIKSKWSFIFWLKEITLESKSLEKNCYLHLDPHLDPGGDQE